MKERPQQEIHHGSKVWVNPRTESMRRTECLCFNCDKSKPGQSDHCRITSSLYQICVKENVAFALTRCPAFSPKQTSVPENLSGLSDVIWICDNCSQTVVSLTKPGFSGCKNNGLHSWRNSKDHQFPKGHPDE